MDMRFFHQLGFGFKNFWNQWGPPLQGFWFGPPQPPQRHLERQVFSTTFFTPQELSIATTEHTAKNTPKTDPGVLNRSTNSPTPKITPEETDLIYSSYLARKKLTTTVFTETDNYSTNDTATVNFNIISLPIKDDTDANHSKDVAITAACSVIAGFVLVGVLVFFFMLKRRIKCLNRQKNNDVYTEPLKINGREDSNKDVYDHVGAFPKIQVSQNAYSFLGMTPREKNNNANTEATSNENVYNCTLDLPMTCASVGDYDSFRKVAEGNDNVTYDTTITHINSTLVDGLYSSMNKCEQGVDLDTNTV